MQWNILVQKLNWRSFLLSEKCLWQRTFELDWARWDLYGYSYFIMLQKKKKSLANMDITGQIQQIKSNTETFLS